MSTLWPQSHPPVDIKWISNISAIPDCAGVGARKRGGVAYVVIILAIFLALVRCVARVPHHVRVVGNCRWVLGPNEKRRTGKRNRGGKSIGTGVGCETQLAPGRALVEVSAAAPIDIHPVNAVQ